LPVRTRFFDDLLRAETERLDQVVLLGAGFDTRAFRLSLPAQLRWFEVDRPELFEEKERVLGEFGAVVRCRRTIVVADLVGAWSKLLLDAGFEVGRRTAWIAEGLLFYLAAQTVRGVLTETSRLAGHGSLVAADVFGSGLLSLPAMKAYLDGRVQRGLEPPFVTDDPVATFKTAGWASVGFALPGQLGATYGRPVRLAKHGPAAPDPTMQAYLVVARANG
jgi:methyltransferase (TIGR00027 family)